MKIIDKTKKETKSIKSYNILKGTVFKGAIHHVASDVKFFES